MRRTLTLLAAAAIALAATVFVAQPAQAHGYVNSPPSRQAFCARGQVPNCGDIIYEPQSVEGPKGLRNCHANNARFAQLSDESKPWPVTSVGTTVTFNWTFTAATRPAPTSTTSATRGWPRSAAEASSRRPRSPTP